LDGGETVMAEDRFKGILKELKRIGFNSYEAKAYIALIRNPDISAYEISKISGVPQSKIYETIKRIVEQGLAVVSGSNPVKYVGLPIDEFLDRYRADVDESIKYLKKNFKSLSEQPSVEYMWHFNEENQLYNKVKSMIEQAKENIHLEMWAQDYDLFYDDILRAKERGVDVVAVLYGRARGEIGRVYYHQMENMEFQVSKYGRWINIVADKKECLFGTVKPGESGGIWTRNKSFMLLSESFILHDILIAEIYSKHKELLDRTYGPNMEKIRREISIG
jgi:sugar-specific transcriptional regulator TrmB